MDERRERSGVTEMYKAEDGCVVHCDGRMVMNFVAWIDEEFFGPEGERRYRIRGRSQEGSAFEFVMDAGTFEISSRLKRRLGAAVGVDGFICTGMAGHLPHALKTMKGRARACRRGRGTPHTKGP